MHLPALLQWEMNTTEGQEWRIQPTENRYDLKTIKNKNDI